MISSHQFPTVRSGQALSFPSLLYVFDRYHPLASDGHQSPPDPQCISSKAAQLKQCPIKSFHLVHAPTQSSPCFLQPEYSTASHSLLLYPGLFKVPSTAHEVNKEKYFSLAFKALQNYSSVLPFFSTCFPFYSQMKIHHTL